MEANLTKLYNLLEDAWELIQDNLPQTLSLRQKIAWKPDGSPVTQADLFHERLLHEFLSSRIPNLTLVAEESYQSGMDLSSEWIAVLDPIDGTENFCSGLKEWGVALSLWRCSRHAGSILMLPELGEVLMSGQISSPYRSRIVGFSSSYNMAIGEGIAVNAESRIMGCSVYNLYNVIRGSYARFLNPKGAWCWDLQAGISLALEAECEVYLEGQFYDGRFLDPSKRHRIDIRNRHNLHFGEGSLG